MNIRFTPVCGKCRHQFTITATPEQYKSIQRNLQFEAHCPRGNCRAINTIRMLDDDFGGQVTSWRMPEPAVPRVPQHAVESPLQAHEPPSAQPPFAQQPVSAAPRSAPPLTAAPTPTSAVPHRASPAPAAQTPAEKAPPRTVASPPPFKRGVIDRRHTKNSALQNQLDRFSQLPPALQYLLLALLFGLAILVLLYEPPRRPRKTGPASAAESPATDPPPTNQPAPAP